MVVMNSEFMISIYKKKSCTGKYMSEPLIFASTNPQYDNRLFIQLPVQYMKIAFSEGSPQCL